MGRLEVKYIGSDVLARLSGLKDSSTGGWVNTATVTGQVKDQAGANVGGAITFSYLASSNGNYEGLLPDDLGLTEHVNYVLEVTADDGVGRKAFWKVAFVARDRP